MSYKAFVFDLDGTLLDTSVDLANAVNLLRAHYSLSPLPIKEVLSYLGDGALQLVEKSLHDSPIDPQLALPVFLALYEDNICVATDFYPGMREVVEELNLRNISVGILTNKPQQATDKLVKILGIESVFKFVKGPDVLGKKPDPNGLLCCLSELGIKPSEALMIGDHHTDMLAGNRAGVTTVFVTYGFGIIGESRADFKIDNAGQLLKFL